MATVGCSASAARTTVTGSRPAGFSRSTRACTRVWTREVREETGLEVLPEALTGVYKNVSRGIVALVFRCRVAGGSLRPYQLRRRTSDGSVVQEVRELMNEAYAVRLLDALKEGPPRIRSHDGFALLADERWLRLEVT